MNPIIEPALCFKNMALAGWSLISGDISSTGFSSTMLLALRIATGNDAPIADIEALYAGDDNLPFK